MKKFLLIGLIVAVALIIVGGTGYAFARVSDQGENQVYGPSMMGGAYGFKYYENGIGRVNRGWQGEGYGPGMMGGQGYGYGPGNGYGPGMMGGQGYGYGPGNGYGPGMMGGQGYGPGPGMMGQGVAGFMHQYMISAFAEAVGLTPDVVQTRLVNGETMVQIATAQGITQDALPDLIARVRTSALDKAVADGVITRAQADLMLEHIDEYMGPGFGPGFGSGGCPMGDPGDWQQQQP
jgi:hypothetical protein